MEKEEQATVLDVTVRRNSWWRSSDGYRMFVVTALVYGGGTEWPIEPTEYEVYENGKIYPYNVAAKSWKESVRSGKIMEWEKYQKMITKKENG